MCVFKKSCRSICVKNVLKLNFNNTNYGGARWIDWSFSLIYTHYTSYLTPCTECMLIVSHKCPLYLMYNNRTVERLTISRHFTLCYQLSTLVCLVLFCCCLLHCDQMHLSPCVKPCIAKYFTRNKGNTATYLSHRTRSHGPSFDIRWS